MVIEIKVRAITNRRLGWVGHVAKIEEGRTVFKTLTGKPARKGTFRKA